MKKKKKETVQKNKAQKRMIFYHSNIFILYTTILTLMLFLLVFHFYGQKVVKISQVNDKKASQTCTSQYLQSLADPTNTNYSQNINIDSSCLIYTKAANSTLNVPINPTAVPINQTIPQASTPTPAGYNLKVPILMYHYIRVNPIPSDTLGFSLSVTPDDFEKQMNYLASNNYTTITVMDLMNALKNRASLPPKPIILTFDDGYIDFYTNAYPVLKKYNLKAESYIITNFVNTSRYMTWDMIKELQASGLITIGSHTLDHMDLAHMSLAKVDQELQQSKKVLEDQLGTPITDFCYPSGRYNQLVLSEVSKAGYVDATTTIEGSTHYATNPFQLTRVRVGGGENLQTYIFRLH